MQIYQQTKTKTHYSLHSKAVSVSDIKQTTNSRNITLKSEGYIWEAAVTFLGVCNRIYLHWSYYWLSIHPNSSSDFDVIYLMFPLWFEIQTLTVTAVAVKTPLGTGTPKGKKRQITAGLESVDATSLNCCNAATSNKLSPRHANDTLGYIFICTAKVQHLPRAQ